MSEQGQMLHELQKAFAKVLNDQADLVIHRDNLKRENKELRRLLKEAQSECKITQESLDGAQREVEWLSDKVSKLPDPYIELQKEAFDDSDEFPFEDLDEKPTEPEKFDLREFIQVAYDLAQPRKTKGLEDSIIIEFNKDNDTEYILVKRDHDKELISEFDNDLEQMHDWVEGGGMNGNMIMDAIRRKQKKWQGMLK